MNVEQRLFVAFALSLAVLLSFQHFFLPQPTKKIVKKNLSEKHPQKKVDKPSPPRATPEKDKPEKKKIEEKIEKKIPTIKEMPKNIKALPPFLLETDLFKMTFDPRGATLSSLVLKKFLNQKQTGSMELIQPFPSTKIKSFLIYDLDKLKEKEGKEKNHLDPARDIEDPLATAYWAVKREKGKIVFSMDLPEKKLIVQKVFEYSQNHYDIKLKLVFQNYGDKALKYNYRINGPSGIAVEETFYYRLEGHIAKYTSGDASISLASQPDSTFTPELPQYREDVTNVHWVGISNKYFTALMHPIDLQSRYGTIGSFGMNKRDQQGKEEYNLYVHLSPAELTVAPQKEVVQNYLIYLGPKDPKMLELYKEARFEEVLSYGWWLFAIFCKLFMVILHFFHNNIIANYGLAIIFLTLLVKGSLFPLDYKAQRSMMMMQKIQPKMKAIQAKYKGKKDAAHMQKQQKEMMELYQEHGVNPLGGCLPMLLQLPVFIGLYQLLSMDIALRQAPFLGWIQDLSMPDSLVAFDQPWQIFFFTFSGVHILPICMVILMVIQQKLQPKTDDPQQQQQRKMMMFMMAFMGFIFYNFPSGLVLYFICQSIIGVTEQKLILKHLKAQEEQA